MSVASSAEIANLEWLFTNDQEVIDSGEFDKIIKNLEEDKVLENNNYLNRNLTVLDHVLISLKKRIDERAELEELIYKDFTSFEKKKERGYTYNFITTKTEVFYVKGKILLQLTISDLGKPKEPIKKSCDSTLDTLENHFHESLYPHDVFKPLVNWLSEESIIQARELQNNIALIVELKSTYNSIDDSDVMENEMFIFQCAKFSKNAETIYHKLSLD
ncbi:hypothetical protein N8253_00405 [Pelagibacterales bacterium]|nr:hypothetical protein [Pelagibacterales bacterium]